MTEILKRFSDAEIASQTISHWLEGQCRGLADLPPRDYRISKTLWMLCFTVYYCLSNKTTNNSRATGKRAEQMAMMQEEEATESIIILELSLATRTKLYIIMYMQHV